MPRKVASFDPDCIADSRRPLVRSGGSLIAVNNALCLRGVDFLRELEGLCAGGCLAIDKLISVPKDITGFAATRVGAIAIDVSIERSAERGARGRCYPL